MQRVYFSILVVSLIVCHGLEAQAQLDKPDCSEACKRAGISSYRSCTQRKWSEEKDCGLFAQWVENQWF